MKQKKIFDGIKIADFSVSVVGPLTTMIMAEFGATVVHVENHSRLELLRAAGPYKDGIPGTDRSAHFAAVNANKYGMSLDLTKPKGVEVAKRLAKWADIFVESMSPGKMKKWNLDYESVKAINPDIIYMSSSLQGQYGPLATQAGYGTQAAALAGMYEVTGFPDGPATFIYCAYTDFISPPYIVTAISAALVHRYETGEGTHIDHSQIETGVGHLGHYLLDCTVNNRVMPRMGNRDLWAAPHGCYRCSGDNNFCVIAVHNETEWKSLCKAIGKPDLIEDKRFSSLTDRKINEDALDDLIENWTSSHTPEEVMNTLQAVNVSAGIVQNPKYLFEDPQLKHREHFHWLDHPVIGTMPYQGQSFKFSKTPEQVVKNAPCLGEDNEYIYKDILGYSDDEISDMYAEGIITVESGETVKGLF